MALGVDYAFGPHPSISALKAKGVKFVVRYVGSTDHTKSRSDKWLSKSEKDALHKEFDITVVFETTSNRAESGHAGGVADAKKAQAELEYLGLPKDMAVYFAVDYDTTVGPNIRGYFEGVASVLGLHRVGVYGGYKVVSVLMKEKRVTYGWQTYAWSGGKWHGAAQLQQYSNGVKVGGADCDLDRSEAADFGQWPKAGTTPTKPSTAVTAPSGSPVLKKGSTGSRVKALQTALNKALKLKLSVDGDFGSKTESAVKVLQAFGMLARDGVYGPKSASALSKLLLG